MKIFTRYGVELAVVAALMIVGYGYRQSFISVAYPPSYSAEFLQSLEQLQASVKKAESAEKLFLANLRPADLQEYNEQVRQINYQMGLLSRIAASSAEQKKKVSLLNSELHSYFESVNTMLNQKQKGGALRVPANTISVDKFIAENFPASASSLWSRYHVEMLFALTGVLLTLIFLSRHRARVELKTLQKHNRELHRKSVILDTIIASMGEALIVTDEKGYFSHYNAAAQRIIGSKLKEMASEMSADELGFHDLQSGDRLNLKQLPFFKALHGEEWDDAEFFVRNLTHPTGTYISVSSRSLNEIDGRIGGALVVFKDVSRRKMIEQEWLRAREAAVEASLKKSDFLAAMSHEIRTPMNGVLGMTTLLADTSLTVEQSEYVGVVKRSAESLLMLINDILDYSKIEAGQVSLRHEPFDLEFLCKDTLEIFKPLVKEKNINLSLEMPTHKKWAFQGDAGRIRQVLVNLVGNAVKFTDQGGVNIEVLQTLGLDGAVKLRFEIRDTGPGLKEEERHALFQKYFQTKSGVKAGGTGLGLSISKQLVDLMQGEIGVESVVGLGSTFWFSVSLPLAEAQDVVRTPQSQFAALFKGRVLLVEDQVVNQRVAEAYLRKLGLEVDIAANGLIACEKVLSQSYDLVLMDCQMPVLDGYEATRRIRKSLKEARSRLPIVALTADSSRDKEAYMESGMDDYLAKPLELSHLVEILTKWLPENPSPSSLDFSILRRIENLVVNDQNLMTVLVEDFEMSAPTLLSSMDQGIETQDLQRISEAAHALKSASATLGAKRLSELCAEIENLTDLSAVQFLVKQAYDEYEVSLKELKDYSFKKVGDGTHSHSRRSA